MKKLSGIILARNEEKVIDRCIESLSFCDEILVVDDGSSDETVKRALSKGVRVVSHPLSDDFAAARNFAMKEARGEWLLFVDADEIVTKGLGKEISELIPEAGVVAYRLKRRDVWWGKPLRFGEVRKAAEKGIVRLMKKDSGRWRGTVHEEFFADGQVGTCQHYLNHFAHTSINDFISHVNEYSTIRARELQKNGVSSNAATIVLYPLGKFIYTYFFLLGFLDGAGGFVYSFLMSFHSFLVRSKLYQYTKLDSSTS